MMIIICELFDVTLALYIFQAAKKAETNASLCSNVRIQHVCCYRSLCVCARTLPVVIARSTFVVECKNKNPPFTISYCAQNDMLLRFGSACSAGCVGVCRIYV